MPNDVFKRNKRLPIRVSQFEIDTLKQQAKKKGKKIAPYTREILGMEQVTIGRPKGQTNGKMAETVRIEK